MATKFLERVISVDDKLASRLGAAIAAAKEAEESMAEFQQARQELRKHGWIQIQNVIEAAYAVRSDLRMVPRFVLTNSFLRLFDLLDLLEAGNP